MGVLDGAQLHLVEAATAPPPPFVDDVESAVAESVSDLAPSWTGSSATRGDQCAAECGPAGRRCLRLDGAAADQLGRSADGPAGRGGRRMVHQRARWLGVCRGGSGGHGDPVLRLGRGRITTGPAGVTRGIHESGSVGRVSDHSRICRRGRSRGGGGDPPRSLLSPWVDVVTSLFAAGADQTGTALGLPPERVAGLALPWSR